MACICFEFSKKLRMRTYLAGKTITIWKKNMQKVVNIQWTEFPPVSYLWILRKIQLRSIWMCKLKVNYFFTILLYTFSETISWAKNNKMGHC